MKTFAIILWLFSAVVSRADELKPVITVADFDNLSKNAELADFGKGLSMMFLTDLSNSGEFKTVERSRLLEVLKELKLQAGAEFDKASAVKTGKLLGAQYLVTGGFLVDGTTARIDARAIDTSTGEVVAAATGSAAREKLFDTQKTVALSLLEKLGSKLSLLSRKKIELNRPASLEALNLYSGSIAARDRGTTENETALLRKAQTADKDFFLVNDRLHDLESRVNALEHAGGQILDPKSREDYLHNVAVSAAREAQLGLTALEAYYRAFKEPPPQGKADALLMPLAKLREYCPKDALKELQAIGTKLGVAGQYETALAPYFFHAEIGSGKTMCQELIKNLHCELPRAKWVDQDYISCCSYSCDWTVARREVSSGHTGMCDSLWELCRAKPLGRCEEIRISDNCNFEERERQLLQKGDADRVSHYLVGLAYGNPDLALEVIQRYPKEIGPNLQKPLDAYLRSAFDNKGTSIEQAMAKARERLSGAYPAGAVRFSVEDARRKVRPEARADGCRTAVPRADYTAFALAEKKFVYSCGGK